MPNKKKEIELTLSDFAENFFVLSGRPLSLDDYPHMREIYNTDAQKSVMKFSRQTSKSTTLANIMLARACLTPNFKQLYVSPAVAQTQEFARDKLEPVINNSPLIKDNFVTSNQVQNVLKKEFINGSVINLRYALLNADRIRGISADVNYFDECYTPNMQVLSKRGWLDFTEIKAQDFLGTVNPKTNAFEWQQPSRVIAKPHVGQIMVIKGVDQKLEVTPNHNIYVAEGSRPAELKEWKLAPAINYLQTPFYMLQAPKGEFPFPEAPVEFVFPGGSYTNSVNVEITYPEFKIPTKKLGEFLGVLLTSSKITKGNPGLKVELAKKRKMAEYSKLLKELGVNHQIMPGKRHTPAFIYIFDYAIEAYIQKLGATVTSREFPYEILDTHGSIITDLIKGLAWDTLKHSVITAAPVNVFHFSSKKLAEAFQQLNLLLGKTFNVIETLKAKQTKDRKNAFHSWSCTPRESTMLGVNNQVIGRDRNDATIELVPYSGEVYCATVPNGTLIVSNKTTRYRVPLISGNCQDLLKDVITVTEETMSRSLVKKSIYAGTPKRTKGTLADLWFNSTQNEYAVKSHRSGNWNILGPDNIGANGLIDKKTGLPLDLRIDKGEWVSTYDNATTKPYLEGFRVCLLHFAHAPWVDWQRDVITKMENTSTALFYNETLGLEYDSGAVPITKAEIIAACNPEQKLQDEPPPDCIGRPSIMGIDYGPVNSDSSHTVISIIQQRENKFQVVYTKKFLGKEADYAFIHQEIPKLFAKWNCILLASDYGMGEAPNSEFRSRLGLEKVISFQHLPTQKEPIAYNPKMRAYTMNKTFIMNKFFKMIKTGKLKFPAYEDCANILADLRNVLIEYDEEKNTERYTNVGPDDFAHATIFAMVAGLILFEGMQENLS